jgi:uracil-DNA glycosylase family 4
MKQSEAALALLEELKRLRVEGVTDVFVEEESLLALTNALGNSPKAIKSAPEVTAPSVSVPQKPLANPPKEVSADEQKSPNQADSVFPPSPEISLPAGSKESQWIWLKEKVENCEVCNKELNPKGKVVFGVGNLDADLFLCGEAPGAEEEMQGEPFVGPAGDLLTKILEAMGLSRDDIYISNILNWRPRHDQPYGNRPPTPEEMSFCLPYLKAQIGIVKPKVLVALGKTATDGLLGHDPKRRLADSRGKWNQAFDIPMMVTYHPSYLLHNPSKTSKRKVWEDMLLVMEKLEINISEKQRAFFS